MALTMLDKARQELLARQQAVTVADAEYRGDLLVYVTGVKAAPLGDHMSQGIAAIVSKQKLDDAVAERDRWARIVAWGTSAYARDSDDDWS